MQNSVLESCMFSFYYALSVLLDTAFHYGIHCSEFRIHVLCQSDLALCTDQIMLVPLDLKILVTDQIVIEEACCELAGNRKVLLRKPSAKAQKIFRSTPVL